MLTLLTSTWGIMAISALVGAVMGHGLGYDSCFRDKIEVRRATEYLFAQREELLEMARQEIKTGDPFTHKMSNQYYDTARNFSVKVGTHDDC